MLYINDDLRIKKLDDKCLALEKNCEIIKKSGEQTKKWKFCGYYGSLEQALAGATKKQLHDATETTERIDELLKEIDTLRSEILDVSAKWKQEEYATDIISFKRISSQDEDAMNWVPDEDEIFIVDFQNRSSEARVGDGMLKASDCGLLIGLPDRLIKDNAGHIKAEGYIHPVPKTTK